MNDRDNRGDYRVGDEIGAVISPETLQCIEDRLGRPPRGLRAVAVADGAGAPMVIRVASLVDEKPFPTLYWLIDPHLNLKIDRAEASGLIAQFQAVIDNDPTLQDAMVADHTRHIAHRASFISDAERSMLEDRGQWAALAERGIGGIADFSRIRCLHTWYAAHLVEANTVGKLLDDHWAAAD